MADPFAPRSMKRKNVKGLALTPAAPKPPPTAENRHESAFAPKDEQLEIGIEYKLDLRPEDLEVIRDLGHGNGGTVSKVKHNTTGTVMARKVIHVEAKREIRKRIVLELQIMHSCHSEFIVNFYGAFLNPNNDVIMCMEYMDVGSLDRVSRVFGPVRVDVLGKIAVATLGGLTYLYSKHHIMHRDIKPSNVLVNSQGFIKLCDFGVSGELVNSVADTFVGTSTYMAPERIQGEKYTVKSDVWSFGLTIMEMAIGKFPFAASEQLSDGDGAPAGILDLLQQIVHEPAPRLPKSDAFPSILEDMIQKCLFKEPERRPTPQDLFDREPFVQAAKRTPVDLREWAVSLLERDNRKSHLAPQLSPATQELLRSNDSPPIQSQHEELSIPTPTSGDIPIAGAGFMSPRDQFPPQSRSPTRSTAGLVPQPLNSGMSSNPSSGMSRSPLPLVHPGLGARSATTNSITKVSTYDREGGHGSVSNGNVFSLPSRNESTHGSHGSVSGNIFTLPVRSDSGHGSSSANNFVKPLRPAESGHGSVSGNSFGLPSRPAETGHGSVSGNTFSLPVRPAPLGSLPPPPPRKETPEGSRRETPREMRRQPTWGLPSNPNPAYGL